MIKILISNILILFYSISYCQNDEVTNNYADTTTFTRFINKFSEIKLPAKITGFDPGSLSPEDYIDSLYLAKYIYVSRYPDSVLMCERIKYYPTRYGYLIYRSNNFIAVTHLESAPTFEDDIENYLTTFNVSGKMISQVLIGKYLDEIDSLILSECSIDKNLSIIVNIRKYDNDKGKTTKRWKYFYTVNNNGEINYIN